MKHFIKDIRSYAYYIVYAAKTDLKAEVANSYLNWIWWILEPFCEMLIFTFVFGILFASSEEYFPVYIYSGLIMWKFFSQTLNHSVTLVRRNKGIITKVYVPKFVFLLENMCLNAFKLLISFSVLIVLIVAYRMPIRWQIIYLLPIYAVFFMITFSCSVILLHFGVFVDDLSYAISILLRLLFYVSGIFYNIDKRFPAHAAHVIKLANPIAMIMDSMHNALIYGAPPKLSILAFWFCVALVLAAVGIKTVYNYENSYVKVI